MCARRLEEALKSGHMPSEIQVDGAGSGGQAAPMAVEEATEAAAEPVTEAVAEPVTEVVAEAAVMVGEAEANGDKQPDGMDVS